MTDPLKRGQDGTRHLNRKLVSIASAPVDTAKSMGELTVDTQPIAGDTMTIGATLYTFVADGSEASTGDISVGADLAGAQVNIVKAILGTDAVNPGNFYVTCAAAFALDALDITAKSAGAAGDLIPTTETFDEATNVFDAATLGTAQAGVGTVAQCSHDLGDMICDLGTLYICVSENTDGEIEWRKVALSNL